jgi:hypothetical protein
MQNFIFYKFPDQALFIGKSMYQNTYNFGLELCFKNHYKPTNFL